MAALAPVALPLMLAGSAVSAFGTYAQGQSQGQALSYNAMIERAQARQAREQSYVEASQTEKQIAARKGQAMGALAAAGVDPNTGSSLHVLNQIASEGEMARQLKLYQGRVNAMTDEEQSDADLTGATAAKTGAWVGAGSTLLSGAAQASMYSYRPQPRMGG